MTAHFHYCASGRGRELEAGCVSRELLHLWAGVGGGSSLSFSRADGLGLSLGSAIIPSTRLCLVAQSVQSCGAKEKVGEVWSPQRAYCCSEGASASWSSSAVSPTVRAGQETGWGVCHALRGLSSGFSYQVRVRPSGSPVQLHTITQKQVKRLTVCERAGRVGKVAGQNWPSEGVWSCLDGRRLGGREA